MSLVQELSIIRWDIYACIHAKKILSLPVFLTAHSEARLICEVNREQGILSSIVWPLLARFVHQEQGILPNIIEVQGKVRQAQFINRFRIFSLFNHQTFQLSCLYSLCISSLALLSILNFEKVPLLVIICDLSCHCLSCCHDLSQWSFELICVAFTSSSQTFHHCLSQSSLLSLDVMICFFLVELKLLQTD